MPAFYFFVLSYEINDDFASLSHFRLKLTQTIMVALNKEFKGGCETMFDKLENSLRFHQETVFLLNKRQGVLAANIANADTPGYLARDMDFSVQLKNSVNRTQRQNDALSLELTTRKHIPAKAPEMGGNSQLLYRIPDQPSADGNTVDMDRERTNFLDNNIKYQSGLTFLGGQIKSMMNVINQS
jgi:flagellar basal-body rod protein FlgB